MGISQVKIVIHIIKHQANTLWIIKKNKAKLVSIICLYVLSFWKSS